MNSRSTTRQTLTELLAGGALLLAAGMFLFSTKRGRALRVQAGKSVGGALGGQLGRWLGAQVGGHPIRVARAARRTRQLKALFGS
jgi:hypothetical protein